MKRKKLQEGKGRGGWVGGGVNSLEEEEKRLCGVSGLDPASGDRRRQGIECTRSSAQPQGRSQTLARFRKRGGISTQKLSVRDGENWFGDVPNHGKLHRLEEEKRRGNTHELKPEKSKRESSVMRSSPYRFDLRKIENNRRKNKREAKRVRDSACP